MSEYINTIWDDDFREVLPSVPDSTFDAAIVDPPFGQSKVSNIQNYYSRYELISQDWDMFGSNEYPRFNTSLLGELSRVVKPNGNMLICASMHSLPALLHTARYRFDLKICAIITCKRLGVLQNLSKRGLRYECGYVVWLVNNSSKRATKWVFHYELAKAINDGKQLTDIWTISKLRKAERHRGRHPAQKSSLLISRLVALFTNPGDLIIDCCSGSGTTGLCASSMGRRYTLIDSNPAYNDIADARISNNDFVLYDLAVAENLRNQIT